MMIFCDFCLCVDVIYTSFENHQIIFAFLSMQLLFSFELIIINLSNIFFFRLLRLFKLLTERQREREPKSKKKKPKMSDVRHNTAQNFNDAKQMRRLCEQTRRITTTTITTEVAKQTQYSEFIDSQTLPIFDIKMTIYLNKKISILLMIIVRH